MSLKRVVGYCRYSTEMQRDESIEAQQRAITRYCESSDLAISKWYIDKAQSASISQRDEFQTMLKDALNGEFDILVFHKLDRFVRDLEDQIIFLNRLKDAGVVTKSVCETIEDTPAGRLSTNIYGAFNQYYSDNLRVETMKGLCENAYKAQYNGGTVPYGLSVDPTDKKYIINPHEAEAVKLIFIRTVERYSYQEIQQELTAKGFRTRDGKKFTANSLYSILHNEKYTGTYIYNKSAAAKKIRTDGVSRKTRNGHKTKDRSEWIIIENGLPAIISKETFEAVQKILAGRVRSGQAKAKQTYLLSGKIICGDCGSVYAGNYRKSYGKQGEYISYRCTRKNKTLKCSNKEIKRDLVEEQVLKILSNLVFNNNKIPELVHAYENYCAEQNQELIDNVKRQEKLLDEVNKKLSNTANAIASCGLSDTLQTMLASLEREKTVISSSLAKARKDVCSITIDVDALTQSFRQAKRAFENGTLENMKAIVQDYVEKVIVFEDKMVIMLNLQNEQLKDLLEKEEASRKSLLASSFDFSSNEDVLAEREGFEPSNGFIHYTISNRAPSTSSAISPWRCSNYVAL
ncbi:MAG: resolvase [Oscillospiraceae bacterium]|nr:resolvase [Oscillospiraceae bacterium]